MKTINIHNAYCEAWKLDDAIPSVLTPVGLAVGSQMNLLLATEEMMKQVGYDDTRVIPVHEERLAERFPSRITKENLRISEICLADSATSAVS
jgi:hypothetical protein